MKLKEIELDALKEIANIGSGNAATSLSTLIEKRVRMSVTSTYLVAIEQAAEALGGAERSVSAIYLRISGSISGSFLLVFSPADADRLAFSILGRGSEKAVRREELAQSALKELSNVYAGTYFTALSQMMGLRFFYSVPEIATDMLQAVLDGILIELASDVEHVLVLDTIFEVDREKVRAHTLFLPDPQGLAVILNALHLHGERKGRKVVGG